MTAPALPARPPARRGDGGGGVGLTRRDSCPRCGSPVFRFIDFGLHEVVMCGGPIGCFYTEDAWRHDFRAAWADLRDSLFAAFYVPQLVAWLDRQLRRFAR